MSQKTTIGSVCTKEENKGTEWFCHCVKCEALEKK